MPAHLLSNVQERLGTVQEEETYEDRDGLWQSSSFPAAPSAPMGSPRSIAAALSFKQAYQDAATRESSMSQVCRRAFGGGDE